MSSQQNVFVGRQPIYDRRLNVVAYELLFRTGTENRALVTDPERATSELLANTFVEIGLGEIVGSARAFVNVTRDFLLGEYPLPPAESRVALEILEGVKVDEALLNGVTELSRQGYTIVLDDFVFHPSLQPLVELADIVKLDIRALEPAALREHVTRLRRFNVELLAEKVETQSELELCRILRFDLFQGFFFCKPTVVAGARLPANQIAAAQLLSHLQDPAAEFGDLEQMISRDAALSYKLLRMVNSAFYAVSRKVDSIKQALLLLGLRTIRNWACLIVMSDVGEKPRELLVTGLVRARMCELLAARLGRKPAEAYFTVGLFSVLDALLDKPMAEVLEALPLAEAANAALLDRRGPLGETLGCVLAYERGRWDDVALDGLADAVIGAAYLEAIAWADGMGGQIHDE
jgi:EAL and modified HD-GYP domain-containing signal transduction protein